LSDDFSTILVNEFIKRQRLSKLGFTTNLEELDIYTFEAFSFISSALTDIESQEMEKQARKRRG